ncbi:hypothetical protein IFR05_013676 [Cadophora sp. M221]|nr:hypothetical protein IFR05_013676 [Cadophora sp. M221]
MSEVKSSWDFSKLEALDITGMNHDAFFESVDAKWFPKLRDFQVGTLHCRLPSDQSRKRKQVGLHNFPRKMSQLEILSMNAYTKNFPLDILMAMENLEVLEFTEANSFPGDGASPPRLDMQDLEELLQYLPRLVRFNIDFKAWAGDFKRDFLDMVSQFPALKTIHMNNHGDNTEPSEDPETITAMKKLPNVKRVYIYQGKYVERHVAQRYDAGHKRYEGFEYLQWFATGGS